MELLKQIEQVNHILSSGKHFTEKDYDALLKHRSKLIKQLT